VRASGCSAVQLSRHAYAEQLCSTRTGSAQQGRVVVSGHRKIPAGLQGNKHYLRHLPEEQCGRLLTVVA
jgi:hypothetical protein